MTHPGRYTDVFTYGYLAILEEAERLRGRCRSWLKHFLCYEIAGYFARRRTTRSPMLTEGPLGRAVARARRRGARAGRAGADLETPRVPRGRPRAAGHHARLPRRRRGATRWCSSTSSTPSSSSSGLATATPATAPVEEISNGDAPSRPRHAKTRDLRYFGRVLMRERILWLRYRPDLRIRLDGDWAKLVFDQPEPSLPTKATPTMVRRYMVEKRRPAYNPLRFLPTTHPGQGAPPPRPLTARAQEVRPQLGADGPHPQRRRQRRDPVQAPARRTTATSTPGSCSRRRPPTAIACARRGTATGWSPTARGQWRTADGQLRAPALLARRRAGDQPAADPGVHRAAVALHLPPARRDQGRPLALAQLQERSTCS